MSRMKTTARGVVMGNRSRLAALAVFLLAGTTVAQPQNPTVVAGSATFSQNGSTTTITAANGTIINYTGFNVPLGSTVNFVQPTSTSTVLNRINSAAPTLINGAVNANGIVYFVNPSGIIFGNGAVINVGQIYAAAGNITDADFLSGVNRFTTFGGEVINHGSITGQRVALIGSRVANFGQLVATGDAVVMAAGDQVTVREDGGRINVRIDTLDPKQAEGFTSPAVENAGVVQGASQISLSSGDMYSLAIRNTGRLIAPDVSLAGGAGGIVEVRGDIDASNRAPGGTGGSVTITGDYIGLVDARIDTSGDAGGGLVRIGGDRQGQGPLPNAQGVYVSSTSRIYADAITTGQGGEIILFAQQVGRIYGQLYARGGAQGGNGGFIETSAGWLDIGSVSLDLSASAGGKAGTWLIDPTEIIIAAADGTGGGGPTAPTGDGLTLGTAFTGPAAATPTQIGVGQITAQLNNGANVFIATTDGPAGAGTITLTVPLVITPGAPALSGTLTMNAHNGIILNAPISFGNNTGYTFTLNLNAGNTTTNAPVTFNSSITGSVANSQSINIVVNGASFPAGGGFGTGFRQLVINNTASFTLGSAGSFAATVDSATASLIAASINAGGAITITNLTPAAVVGLGASNISLTGSAITLPALTGGVASGLTINNSGLLAIGGNIAVGSLGFAQTSLGGTTNLFGNISSSGIIQFAGSINLGTAVRTLSGGNIGIAGTTTGAGGGLIVTNSGTFSPLLAAILVDSGGFTQNGTGATNLAQDITTANGGAISFAGNLNLSGTRTLTTAGAGGTVSLATVTGSGTSGLVISNAGALTLNGTVITGSGGFAQTGAGTAAMAGTIGANAGIFATDGASTAAAASGSVAFASALALGNATRTIVGTTVGLAAVTGGAASGLTITNSGLLTLNNTVIVGSGGFTQNGAGTSAMAGTAVNNAGIFATDGASTASAATGAISFATALALGNEVRALTGTTVGLFGITGGAASGLNILNTGLLTLNRSVIVGSGGFSQDGGGNVQMLGNDTSENFGVAATNGSNFNAAITGAVSFGSNANPNTLNLGNFTRAIRGSTVSLFAVRGGALSSLFIESPGTLTLNRTVIVGAGGFTRAGNGDTVMNGVGTAGDPAENLGIAATDGSNFNGPVLGPVEFLGTGTLQIGDDSRSLRGNTVVVNEIRGGASSALLVDSSGSFTVNGTIVTGSGGFSKIGAGGTNFTGGTSLGIASTDGVNFNGAVTGQVFFQSNALEPTINLGNVVRSFRGQTVDIRQAITGGAASGLNVFSAANFSFSRTIIVGSGGFTRQGTGNTVFSGTAAQNAGIFATNGTSTAAAASGAVFLGDDANPLSANLGAEVRRLVGTTVGIAGITGGAASGLTITNSGLLTIARTVIVGSGGFTQNGSGLVAMAGTGVQNAGIFATNGTSTVAAPTGNVSIATSTALGAALRTLLGNAVSIGGTTTGAGGGLTITNAGLLSITGNILVNSGGFTQNGAGNVSLSADISAANGGNIAIATSTELNNAVRTLTTAGAGTISLGAVTVVAGPAGGLVVNNGGLLTLNSTITVGSGGFSQTGAGTTAMAGSNATNAGVFASGGAVGPVAFATALNLGNAARSLVGTTVSLAAVTGGAASGLTITNSGLLTLNNTVIVGSGGFTQNGTGTTLMNGSAVQNEGIFATDGASTVALATGTVNFATSLGLGTAVRTLTGLPITISGTTTGAGGGLIVNSASTLNIVNAPILVDSGGFTQNTIGSTNLNQDITAANGGAILFTGAINLGGTGSRTLTTAGAGGTVTLFDVIGSATSGLIINNSGLLTIGSTVITGSGGFAQIGAGSTALTGSGAGNLGIAATDGANFGAAQTGAVSFAQSLALGTAARAIRGTTVALAAVTGGAASGLTVANTGLLSLNGNVAVQSGGFTQSGGGGVSLAGDITATNGGNISIADTLNLNNAVRTLNATAIGLAAVNGGAASGLAVTNAGLLTLNNTVLVGSGGFTQNGAGTTAMVGAAGANAGIFATDGASQAAAPSGAINFATALDLGNALRTFVGTTMVFPSITGGAASGFNGIASNTLTLNDTATVGTAGFAVRQSGGGPALFTLGDNTGASSITTTGQALFLVGMRLDADSTITANTIRLLAGVENATATARSLTLDAVTPGTASFPAPPLGAPIPIILSGDIGTLASPLAQLLFPAITNPAWTNPAIAHAATIVLVGGGASNLSADFNSVLARATSAAYGATAINATTFTMGQFQRLTAFGDLSLTGTGTATLGDITVIGNLTLATARAYAVSRTIPHSGMDQFGAPVTSPTTGIVANQLLSTGAGAIPLPVGVTVGTSSGVTNAGFTIGGTLTDATRTPANSPITPAVAVSAANPALMVPVSLAPGQISSVFRPFVLPPTLAQRASDRVALPAGIRALLAELGVQIAGADDLLTALTGRAIYNDFYDDQFDRSNRLAIDARVSERRLELGRVEAALKIYREMRGQQSEGDSTTNRIPERQGQLRAAFRAYQTVAGGPASATPQGFQEYLEKQAAGGGDEAALAGELVGFVSLTRQFVAAIDNLGLTASEAAIVRGKVIAQTLPSEMRRQQAGQPSFAEQFLRLEAAPALPSAGNQ